MRKCKACGADFSSSDSSTELCITCNRALRQLGTYVAPVKRGEWVDYDEDNPLPLEWRYRCSLCGCPQDYAHNYCPNCGARMKEDDHGRHQKQETAPDP